MGIAKVEGQFDRGEVISCLDNNGQLIAKGVVNYNSDEADKIKRQPTKAIEGILGYIDRPELIHRDNLVLL